MAAIDICHNNLIKIKMQSIAYFQGRNSRKARPTISPTIKSQKIHPGPASPKGLNITTTSAFQPNPSISSDSCDF
jgi:hypothetical protein